MKRIAIVEENYVRDVQVFTSAPGIIGDNPDLKENFKDAFSGLYLGIIEGGSEDEIKNKAAGLLGVHQDIISLINPGQPQECAVCRYQPMTPKTDNLDEQDTILCPACGYGLMGADEGDYFEFPKFCSDCGQKLDWGKNTPDIETVYEFELFNRHAGHKIKAVPYGNRNITLECADCHEALYSADKSRSKTITAEKNTPAVINKVYKKGSGIPLKPVQLAKEAGFNITPADYPARISGSGHCDCPDGGEFELYPKSHPSVKSSGGKRYMKCRICGGVSHL